jgi:hypothetical protein
MQKLMGTDKMTTEYTTVDETPVAFCRPNPNNVFVKLKVRHNNKNC